MGVDIRFPQITGATEKEQLAQIKSYLYQFAEQLQWALQNVNTANNAVVVQEAAKSLYPTGNTGSGTVQDPLATFAAIKSLIIKNADIVKAYYDVISEKLVGEYKALSEFGTFKEETEQKITETSTAIERSFENTQIVETTLIGKIADFTETLDSKIDSTTSAVASEAKEKVSELSLKLEEKYGDLSKDITDKTKEIDGKVTNLTSIVVNTSATIKSGLLYYDKLVPVYGIEVGQTNKIEGEEVFKKFARLTAEKLSFYDNYEHEVAYISDSKLYITGAAITNSFDFGGYRVTVTDDGGLTGRWVDRT